MTILVARQPMKYHSSEHQRKYIYDKAMPGILISLTSKFKFKEFKQKRDVTYFLHSLQRVFGDLSCKSASFSLVKQNKRKNSILYLFVL